MAIAELEVTIVDGAGLPVLTFGPSQWVLVEQGYAWFRNRVNRPPGDAA